MSEPATIAAVRVEYWRTKLRVHRRLRLHGIDAPFVLEECQTDQQGHPLEISAEQAESAVRLAGVRWCGQCCKDLAG